MADERRGNGGSQRTPKSVWVAAEKYIQIGLTLPAGTVVGWFLGEFLQRWFHFSWLPMAGLILGTISGFIYFIRMAMSEDFKD